MLTQTVSLITHGCKNVGAFARTCIELGGKPFPSASGYFLNFGDVPVRALRHRLRRFGSFRVRKSVGGYIVHTHHPDASLPYQPSRNHLASVYRKVRAWVRDYIEEHYTDRYTHDGVEFRSLYWPIYVPYNLGDRSRARVICFTHTVREIVENVITHQGWVSTDDPEVPNRWTQGRSISCSCPDIVSAYRREHGIGREY